MQIKRFNEEKLTPWELDTKIDKILEGNIREIPWEGTEVDKAGIKEDILNLIYELCPEYNNNLD